MDILIKPFRASGRIKAQPSKSDAHRKLICAAFSDDACSVENVIISEDIKATLNALKAMGQFYEYQSSTEESSGKVSFYGRKGLSAGIMDINCGESGTTLRFMAMIAAFLEGEVILNGRGRLPSRPMNHAIDFMRRYDVECSYPGTGMFLPMHVKGTARGNYFVMDSSVSSQFLSGILLGMVIAGVSGKVLAEGKFESKGYVDMTVSVLKDFGADINGKNPFEIRRKKLSGTNCTVEGDWSNSSYFLAMKAMGAKIEVIGLSPKSQQPDRVITELLESMSDQQDNFINVGEHPDLMPTLAVYAATLPVNTTIKGERLRYKESDRIKAVHENMQKIGVESIQLEDGLVIRGNPEIKGGTIDSFNDHRIAMAFSVLGSISKEDIMIRGAECVDKSYPGFFNDLAKVGGEIL